MPNIFIFYGNNQVGIILKDANIFINLVTSSAKEKAKQWQQFLTDNNFDFNQIEKIDMDTEFPVVHDKAGNKFSINFDDNKNYLKVKKGIKSEIISKALGAGKYGLQVLDLSAGLGIDAVFLSQLGYNVIALERNPLIFLCLENALKHNSQVKVKFIFGDAQKLIKDIEFLKNKFDVVYFDPMFPQKNKSALPKQEMVFFKSLVGEDSDAADVLQQVLCLPHIKRVAVKRSIKAPELLKPMTQVKGKLVRFDIYGVFK